MPETSRLEAARQDQDATVDAWYRSPLVLIAGAILFLGALALVVLSIGGGDEATDAPAVVAASGSATDSAAPVPSEIESPGISFGGVEVPEVDAVVLRGDALPLLKTDQEDAAIGMLAPQITATSLANGSPITLGPGRARVIGFFAHWCPHCQAELPEVTQWLAETQLPPNTEFIAVSTAIDPERGNFPPSAWFNDVGFNAPVLVDDGESTLLNGLGFTGFPAFIAIDASGVVVDRAGGNIGVEGLAALYENFAG